MMGDYQVLFSGEVVQEADPEGVCARLAHELSIDDRKARQLFTGRTVVIKSQLSQSEAEELQVRLEALGARCRIKNLALPTTASAGPTIDKDASRLEAKQDCTLKDITAAHIECPRCGHLQLESSHCVTCGVDVIAAVAQKRKEDLLIEKKIRDLRSKQGGPQQGGPQQGGPQQGGPQQGGPQQGGPQQGGVRAEASAAIAVQTAEAEPIRAGSRALDGKRSGFIRSLFKKTS
jgi:hypothetical protein